MDNIFPPISSRLVAEKLSRVNEWVGQLQTPPPEHLPPLKRKHAMSESRNSSPKRLRSGDDAHYSEVFPTHAASTPPSIPPNPLELTAFTTLSSHVTRSLARSPSSTSSPRRGSPTRETITSLAFAHPPIKTETISGAHDVPARVSALCLRISEELDKGWIPASLEASIANDKGEIGLQLVGRSAYSPPGHDHVEVEQRTYTELKRIFIQARKCQEHLRDENAWSMHVVEPLFRLALSLYSESKLLLENVKSQAIASDFLSRRNTSPKAPLHDRRADYAIQYSDEPSGLEDLYKRLSKARRSQLSHLNDAYTKKVALFAGGEVKQANGDKTEAGYQLSIFTAASLRKKAQLAHEANMSEAIANLVEPGFTVIGHNWNFYIGYCENGDDVHILDLDIIDKCSSSSISGLYKLLKVWSVLIDYAISAEEASFWGGFFGPVLNRLASEERREGRDDAIYMGSIAS